MTTCLIDKLIKVVPIKEQDMEEEEESERGESYGGSRSWRGSLTAEKEMVLLAEGPGGEVVLTMDEPPANKKDDIEHNLNGERIAPRWVKVHSPQLRIRMDPEQLRW